MILQDLPSCIYVSRFSQWSSNSKAHHIFSGENLEMVWWGPNLGKVWAKISGWILTVCDIKTSPVEFTASNRSRLSLLPWSSSLFACGSNRKHTNENVRGVTTYKTKSIKNFRARINQIYCHWGLHYLKSRVLVNELFELFGQCDVTSYVRLQTAVAIQPQNHP